MDSSPLLAALRALAASNTIPFHMPGHHRACSQLPPDLPYALDITELPGFDDLHRPEGLLRDAMERAAALWGSDRAYFSVNGSTGALLAGIRAATQPGGRVLIARNCHRSVFHAVELCNLRPRWLEPAWLPEAGLTGSVTPQTLAAALADCPGAALCVVTSPTYEGVLSDIKMLTEICHAHGTLLLVDEAHGAHLAPGREYGFPESAVRLGADMVVHSLHKTLPALTQTAVLHLCGGRIDPARLAHQWAVFQTSSPSYPLLASMDWLLSRPEDWWRTQFSQWRGGLDAFRQRSGHLLAPLRADGGDCFAVDPSKLPLDARRFALPEGGAAEVLAQHLRTQGIEPEYALGHIALLMTACTDRPENYERLANALEALPQQGIQAAPVYRLPPLGPQALPLAEAMALPGRTVALADAQGHICAEYLWAYPPGIPLLVPGQRVTRECLEACAMVRVRRSGGDGDGVVRVVG